MRADDNLRDELEMPFPESEIDWRVGHVSKNGDKLMPLAYLTARAVMGRLDDVFGTMNWSTHISPIATRKEDGILCELTVRHEDMTCVVSDVCPTSDIESLKGAASGALKRAAVHLGIGRYLYFLDNVWVPLVTTRPRGKSLYHQGKFWSPPELSAKFLPPTISDAVNRVPDDLIKSLGEQFAAAGYSYKKDKLIIDLMLKKAFGIDTWRDLPSLSTETFVACLPDIASQLKDNTR